MNNSHFKTPPHLVTLWFNMIGCGGPCVSEDDVTVPHLIWHPGCCKQDLIGHHSQSELKTVRANKKENCLEKNIFTIVIFDTYENACKTRIEVSAHFQFLIFSSHRDTQKFHLEVK